MPQLLSYLITAEHSAARYACVAVFVTRLHRSARR